MKAVACRVRLDRALCKPLHVLRCLVAQFGQSPPKSQIICLGGEILQNVAGRGACLINHPPKAGDRVSGMSLSSGVHVCTA